MDEDGDRSDSWLHIYCGTGNKSEIWMHPCPNCGPVTYLGVFIPTVKVLFSDYHSPSFQCHNPGCDPIIEKHDFGDRGVYYDFIDYGAYWAGEDEFYYTPLSPRL